MTEDKKKGKLPKGMTSLGQPGNEEYDKSVRSKIKGSGSDARKMAQRISGMKRMVNPNKKQKRILELISSPKASATQIQELIELAVSKDLSETNFLKLIDIVINKHKAIFGTRLEVENKESNFDGMMNRIRDYKAKEQEATINGTDAN